SSRTVPHWRSLTYGPHRYHSPASRRPFSIWPNVSTRLRSADVMPHPRSRSDLLQKLGQDDAGRRLDQGEVRERLREVAEVVAGLDVVLLGVEPEWRGDAQEPF